MKIDIHLSYISLNKTVIQVGKADSYLLLHASLFSQLCMSFLNLTIFIITLTEWCIFVYMFKTRSLMGLIKSIVF